MTLGELIHEKRLQMGYNLETVASAVGVSKATVSRWESGDIHKMKRDKIEALSSVLQLDPYIFVSPSEVLTVEEHALISAYRIADEGTQNAVKKLLDIG